MARRKVPKDCFVAFSIPLKTLTTGLRKLGSLKPGKESPRLYEKARELLINWCEEGKEQNGKS